LSDAPPARNADLSGRMALVTGAGSGLGARFARVLAAAGATVAVAGRRTENLARLASLIAAEGGRALPVALDVTEADSISQVIERLDREHGPVDILVNNAGVPDARRATKMSTDLVDRLLATNLRGPFLLSCRVAERLIAARRPGRIVNISSMGAFHYEGEGAALYSITKAAIARMTEVLAVEWAGFNINVNAIAPGAFHSEMMAGALQRLGDFSGTLPRKRICDPSLLDSSLLYLCSPASEAVTGTVLKVDDGQFPR
jgi:NAD(P)-dependent dehydrogenase (short-subunit alcohol dehydrogenase family)